MSQVTSLVLTYHARDRRVVEDLVLTATTEDQRFVDCTEAANEGARGPCRKMLQLQLAATAVNGFDVQDLVQRIESAPWRSPEAVMLLVLGEQEMRPAVWGFAGASSFECVDVPRRFVELLERVTS